MVPLNSSKQKLTVIGIFLEIDLESYLKLLEYAISNTQEPYKSKCSIHLASYENFISL